MTEEQQPSEEGIHPADELDLLKRMLPGRDESAGVWLEWHGRHVVCWARIGAENPTSMETAVHLAISHWRNILDLIGDPDSPRARRGYWDLGPTISDLTRTI